MFDLVGVWRLKSSYFIAQETGDRLQIFDGEPIGYAVFEPHGRMVVLMTPSGRTVASSNADQAALYKSMVAYTGKWSIDGEKFSTQVDGAWDPTWVGTEQVRYYAFDGSTLSVRTAPLEHPSLPGTASFAAKGGGGSSSESDGCEPATWVRDRKRHCVRERERTMKIVLSVLVIVWLVIGALAALQRGYFSDDRDVSCKTGGDTVLTIVAGPLNYVGVNPKVDCKVPQPST